MVAGARALVEYTIVVAVVAAAVEVVVPEVLVASADESCLLHLS